MNLIPKRIRHFQHIKEHNWLIHLLMIEFLEEAARTQSSGVLVDVGCGKKPYEIIFSPYVTEYIGIDHQDSPHGVGAVDIVGDAYDTTLADNCCDVVLLTEVLEHLEEPKAALVEISRILKPGGLVICTVPFFWHIHEEPRDFYRYTEFGLSYLFREAGFDDIQIKPLSGYVVTFTQLSIYFYRRIQRFPVLRFLNRIFNYFWQFVAFYVNKIDKSTKFTILYGLTAIKIRGSQERDTNVAK